MQNTTIHYDSYTPYLVVNEQHTDSIPLALRIYRFRCGYCALTAVKDGESHHASIRHGTTTVNATLPLLTMETSGDTLPYKR